MTHRILVADDEPLYLRTTGQLLRKEGYDCVCVSDANQAKQKLNDEDFDLVLSDLNMPGNFKLELLHDHSRRRKHIPMIVITGVPSLPTAIESIRLGITDYLMKPVKFETLLQSVRSALENVNQIQAAADMPTRAANELQAMFPSIIGASGEMLDVLRIVDRIAATDTNILITGESGTGKEVVAKAIHNHSHRAAGMFQVIDCTAIPESLFESMLFGHKKGSFTGAINDQAGLLKQCDGGTAFFDELGELSMTMQAKLLRAVQEQTFTPVGSHTPVKVNTRFVCATNRDLQSEVAAGRFRQDLFYRLGVIHIELAPLRRRGDDVLLLADFFLNSLTQTKPSAIGFSEASIDWLRSHDWPGNVRELRNVIERAVALCRGEVIEPEDFPANLANHPNRETSPKHDAEKISEPGLSGELTDGLHHGSAPRTASREEAIRAAEQAYLVQLLRTHAGNVSEAARQAELSRQGLHKLLKSHGLHAADFRHSPG